MITSSMAAMNLAGNLRVVFGMLGQTSSSDGTLMKGSSDVSGDVPRMRQQLSLIHQKQSGGKSFPHRTASDSCGVLFLEI